MIELRTEEQETGSESITKGSEPGTGRVRLLAALGGIAAGAAALGVGELVGSFRAPEPGPVIAVANRVIDLAPNWFVELGKSIFGLSDKPALIVGTVLLSVVFAAVLGMTSLKRLSMAIAGLCAFGLLGASAIAGDAQGSMAGAIITAGAATIAGIAVLVILRRRLEPTSFSDTSSLPNTQPSAGTSASDTATVAAGQPADARTDKNSSALTDAETGTTPPTVQTVTESPTNPSVNRRSFLTWAGGVSATAAGAAVLANSVRSRSSVQEARTSVALEPEVDSEVQGWLDTAAEADLGVGDQLTPLVVEDGEFYLIDTALVKPQVDPTTWSLRIGGMVDNPIEIGYDELLERSTTVAPVTLSCVSNEVGGGLVGNAVWQGVPLADLLNEAGVQEGATQVASRSIDGWTCGFPTEAVFDGRTALVAVSMNGEPLPVRHGFPARLVVSGLYGYVSATKWITDIELTTLEGFDGYWIPRGWSKLGPVKTQSRIDTPRRRETLVAGEPTAIAGVAWAPDRGVTNVEVSIDDEWVEATLSEELGADAWRQWMVPWTPTAGDHVLAVRATDGDGVTQTADLAPPAPNGASGWHTILVRAE